MAGITIFGLALPYAAVAICLAAAWKYHEEPESRALWESALIFGSCAILDAMLLALLQGDAEAGATYYGYIDAAGIVASVLATVAVVSEEEVFALPSNQRPKLQGE